MDKFVEPNTHYIPNEYCNCWVKMRGWPFDATWYISKHEVIEKRFWFFGWKKYKKKARWSKDYKECPICDMKSELERI